MKGIPLKQLLGWDGGESQRKGGGGGDVALNSLLLELAKVSSILCHVDPSGS